nr:reverse transcriptase domain-containing protein [Tanacetum cinerariifolium]
MTIGLDLPRQILNAQTKEASKPRTSRRKMLEEVITRHGIPVSIISDHDSSFASNLWRSLQNTLGMSDPSRYWKGLEMLPTSSIFLKN